MSIIPNQNESNQQHERMSIKAEPSFEKWLDGMEDPTKGDFYKCKECYNYSIPIYIENNVQCVI